MVVFCCDLICFFKQKTAYEMRISDWSSDVCSSDLDEMLDAVLVQWRVVRTIRPKYSCRSCEKIVQAAAPVKAIARGRASFATLAHVVVNKFDHHLPLYRQAALMAAPGINIDRSTLAGWAGQAAALLHPILARIPEAGLQAGNTHPQTRKSV